MLRRGLIVFDVVLIVLAIIGLLLPRNIHVERSVNIERPAHPLGVCAGKRLR